MSNTTIETSCRVIHILAGGICDDIQDEDLEERLEEGDDLCIRCGRIFTPNRLTALPTAPMSRCCATCAWDNLMKFIERDEP